jgi:hypothetical protein
MAMTKATKCDAEYYGKCGGQLYQYPVVYHCRPREKDLSRGHGPSDSIEKVVLCEGHYNQITDAEENKQLPELYGWDFEDSLEYLTGKLKYTGFITRFCQHCGFHVQELQTETGACSETCIALMELNKTHGSTIKCTCAEALVCSCASQANNKIHWAMLTYVNGFDSNEYECDACGHFRPSWRDSHEQYKNGLVSKADLIAMAKANPELLLQQNAHGKTPMDLIPRLIEDLQFTLDEPFLKCAESGWANSNIRVLESIKKELMEVLDVYAN